MKIKTDSILVSFLIAAAGVIILLALGNLLLGWN